MLAQIVSEFNANPATFLRCSAFSRSVHPDQQDLARRYFSELIKKPFFVQSISPKTHDDPSLWEVLIYVIFPFSKPHDLSACLLPEFDEGAIRHIYSP